MFPQTERFLRLANLTLSGTEAKDKRITAISFSPNHAVALLSSGEVLAIGQNANFELGIGTGGNAAVLTLVATRQPIVEIAAGSGFTLLVTAEHTVIGCGVESQAPHPVPIPDLALRKVAACRSTVAGIMPDGRVIFWPDFRDRGTSQTHALFAPPTAIVCGNGFAAALLEGGLLASIDQSGVSMLYVTSHVADGGERFIAVSASDTYTIAVDRLKRAWIFGGFAGFGKRYLATTPLFEDVTFVFAAPQYACAITSGFEGLVVGRLPSGELERRPVHLPFGEMALGIIAGNEHEVVGVPLFYTHELALKQLESYIPPKLIAGMPIAN